MCEKRSQSSKWVVVLAAVARATYICESEGKTLSLSDLENVARRAAVGSGAAGDLLAVLLRCLPEFLLAVQSADLEAAQGQISPLPKIQYEIWTGGRHDVVDDISEYRERKSGFSFWIDITNRECASLGKPRKYIGRTARRLLLFLSKHIGMSVSCRDVFEHITGKRPEEHKGWNKLLNVYLTQLQNFAEDDFRKLYLVRDFETDTLSLKAVFQDRYFVFLTLGSTQD